MVALLFLALHYSGTFNQRQNLITDCKMRNAQVAAINGRVFEVNLLLTAETGDRNTSWQDKLLQQRRAYATNLSDCEDEFDRPWPF